MRIVIERSGRSFVTHALHFAMLGLMVYGAFTQLDPIGYLLCAMWVIVSYVRYNMLVAEQVKTRELASHNMEKIRKDLQKFLKENKEHLVKTINNLEEE
jgi:ABC-type siderophore export system fused ATPase/permease subunit